MPRILTGSIDGAVEDALAVAGVRASEPLIDAALLLSGGGPDAADALLGLMAERVTPGPQNIADELSTLFVHLAVARARGDAESGLSLGSRARELMAHLPIEQQRELFSILEAHVGALELSRGEVDRAEVALRHGAVGAPGENPASTAPLDCLGQLALLEGFRGNLRQAERQAAAVLRSAGSGPGAGVAHAHLAVAWIHLERGEHVPARQHLDRAAEAGAEAAGPWYVAAALLAEARWLVLTERPEAALRLLLPALPASPRWGLRSSWTSDLLRHAAADALLASGEPRLAIELLSDSTGTSPVQAALLVARARVDLADVDGARSALASVETELPSAPLAVQIDCWLLARKAGGGAPLAPGCSSTARSGRRDGRSCAGRSRGRSRGWCRWWTATRLCAGRTEASWRG